MVVRESKALQQVQRSRSKQGALADQALLKHSQATKQNSADSLQALEALLEQPSQIKVGAVAVAVAQGCWVQAPTVATGAMAILLRGSKEVLETAQAPILAVVEVLAGQAATPPRREQAGQAAMADLATWNYPGGSKEWQLFRYWG